MGQRHLRAVNRAVRELGIENDPASGPWVLMAQGIARRLDAAGDDASLGWIRLYKSVLRDLHWVAEQSNRVAKRGLIEPDSTPASVAEPAAEGDALVTFLDKIRADHHAKRGL